MDKAVIMARGLGTRMRAANDDASLDEKQVAIATTGVKALMPIGRPFLDYLLGALAEGEFIINAGGDDSTVKQVTKLMNRTVQLEGDEVAQWSTTDSGSDGKVYIAPTS